MDVREKLVELLGGCPCESDCDGVVGSCQNRKYGYCNEIFKLSYCAVSKLAQHLIANGVTVQEWIPVTEMLPDWRDGKVLVFTKYGFSICERTVNNRWRGQHANWITHWTYLPKPPKGE